MKINAIHFIRKGEYDEVINLDESEYRALKILVMNEVEIMQKARATK